LVQPITRRNFIKGVALASGAMMAETVLRGYNGGSAQAQGAAGIYGLPPNYPLPVGYPALPLFQDALPIPGVYAGNASPLYPDSDYYEVGMTQFAAQMGVRDLNGNRVATQCFGYGGIGPTFNPAFPATMPGFVFEARKGRPLVVKWVNNLPSTPLFPFDHVIHGTFDPGTGPGTPFLLRLYPDTRTVVHLHGSFDVHASDGWPMYWFSSDPSAPPNARTMPDGTLMPMGGPAGNYAIYRYTNTQQGTTLWYHDHALGTTRLNVYAGLVGMYILRDDFELQLIAQNRLPARQYEIPLILMDRDFNVYQRSDIGELIFDANGLPIVDPTIPGYGNLHYNQVPAQPGGLPDWMPEMFSDTAIVNGVIRPYLNVDRTMYRFRLLNACQARALELHLEDPLGVQTPPSIVQIGGDGGFLPTPVAFPQPNASIIIMPAERCDVLIDFAASAPGSTFILKNTGAAPYPDGGATDAYGDPIPLVTDMMQFRINQSAPGLTVNAPAQLGHRREFEDEVLIRDLALNDFGGTQASSGLNGLLINNVRFEVAPTFKPVTRTTEVWRILNLAPDTHPIHLHLIQFEIVGRMPFIGPEINEPIDPSQPVYPHPLDPAKPYAPLRWGGVKQYLFDNDLAQYDPVAQDIGYDMFGNQLLLNAQIGYRSGRAGMSGKFWDPTGADPTAPPVPQVPPPVTVKKNGKYLYLTGEVLPPLPNEIGPKDTVRANKNQVSIIRARFDAPPGVSYTDPVTNELTGSLYPIHCHILDHEDNIMMSSYALQPVGTPVQKPRV
jgi:spore coat protein A